MKFRPRFFRKNSFQISFSLNYIFTIDDTTPTAGEEAWGDVTGATGALGGASSEDMMHYSNSSLMDGVTFAVAYVPSGGTTEEESSVDYGVEYFSDVSF